MIMTVIEGYSIDLDSMKASTCGMIGIAEKDGKKYFCKKFHQPVEPADNGVLSPKTIEKNRQEFDAFRNRKTRVNRVLREISGPGGNIVYPLTETIYDHHWIEFSEYIEDTFSDDRYAEVIAGLDPQTKFNALRIAIGALKTIHGQRMVHGDLKLTNIMLIKNSAGNYVSKIIDFDGAFFEDDVPLDSITGTADYYSPELALYSSIEDVKVRKEYRNIITTKSDIFTMGLILHEYLTGIKPQPSKLPPSLAKAAGGKSIYPWQVLLALDKTEEHQLVVSEKIKEPYYVALISDMIQMDWDRRPATVEVLQRLNSKQLVIETDPWPEDPITISRKRALEHVIGLRRLAADGEKIPENCYEIVDSRGMRYRRSAAELVDMGIAENTGSVGSMPLPVGVIEPPRPEDGIAWNSEMVEKAFRSIQPAAQKGMYDIVDRNGKRRCMNVSQLKTMGFAAPISTSAPPPAGGINVELPGDFWPEDTKYTLNLDVLNRSHTSFLGAATFKGAKGYAFQLSSGSKVFAPLPRCKMVGFFIER